MGCGSSESVAVINVRSSSNLNHRQETITSKNTLILPILGENSSNKVSPNDQVLKPKFNRLMPMPTTTKFQNMSATDSGVSSKNEDDNDSLDFDEDVKTETSASSDSEFEYDDKDYKNIITENSRPELKDQVEKFFKDRNGLGNLYLGKKIIVNNSLDIEITRNKPRISKHFISFFILKISQYILK